MTKSNMKKNKCGVIAITGRPNVGKSTLMNAFLGQDLSVITPKAQTTRDQIRGIHTCDKGDFNGQIVFIDTPGIHRAKEGGINQFMMNQVQSALEAPDLIWYVVEPDFKFKQEQVVISEIADKGPIFLILNKSDLLKNKQVDLEPLKQELLQQGAKLEKVLVISVKKNQGVKNLEELTWSYMPEMPFLYPDEDSLSDRPMRFFVAEQIRKQLFHKLGQELPYSCAVEINSFNESSKPPRIEATIHVERESQKGMVVGARGKKIKEIGSAARGEIEKLMDSKVFLGLRVGVIPNWSKDKAKLKKLGYEVTP